MTHTLQLKQHKQGWVCSECYPTKRRNKWKIETTQQNYVCCFFHTRNRLFRTRNPQKVYLNKVSGFSSSLGCNQKLRLFVLTPMYSLFPCGRQRQPISFLPLSSGASRTWRPFLLIPRSLRTAFKNEQSGRKAESSESSVDSETQSQQVTGLRFAFFTYFKDSYDSLEIAAGTKYEQNVGVFRSF